MRQSAMFAPRQSKCEFCGSRFVPLAGKTYRFCSTGCHFLWARGLKVVNHATK